MSNKVIDPSEIIVDKEGRIKEDYFHANPWIRFLARFFDYAWFFLLLWGGRMVLKGHLPFGKYESFVPFEFFVWIPIEALFLYTWGATPGKFFLKINLRSGRRQKLDFRTAIKRCFNVWLRGLGMMIPVINAICLLVAYYRLKTFQTTTWDKEDHIAVSHSPIGRWRVIVCSLFTAGALFFYFNAKNSAL
jgi:hypothetical protein